MTEVENASFRKWFFQSFVKILRDPQNFWSHVDAPSQTSRAVWFGVLCLICGIGLEAVVQIFFVDFTEQAISKNQELINQLAPVFNMSVSDFGAFFAKQLLVIKKQSWIMLVLLPFISFFAIYLLAGALHFTLRAFGFVKTTSAPYDATLHIVAFAQAPAVFAFIPVLGPWVSMIWILILIVKGLKHHYQLGSFSGAVAVLAPALFIKLTWASALQLLVLSVPNQYFDHPNSGVDASEVLSSSLHDEI